MMAADKPKFQKHPSPLNRVEKMEPEPRSDSESDGSTVGGDYASDGAYDGLDDFPAEEENAGVETSAPPSDPSWSGRADPDNPEVPYITERTADQELDGNFGQAPAWAREKF